MTRIKCNGRGLSLPFPLPEAGNGKAHTGCSKITRNKGQWRILVTIGEFPLQKEICTAEPLTVRGIGRFVQTKAPVSTALEVIATQFRPDFDRKLEHFLHNSIYRQSDLSELRFISANVL
jgi:hypothetical protein